MRRVFFIARQRCRWYDDGMEIIVAYGFMVLLAAVAVWQAVCVAVWVWGKMRKPVERAEAPEPDAVQRSLERIVQDMERREENGKSA